MFILIFTYIKCNWIASAICSLNKFNIEYILEISIKMNQKYKKIQGLPLSTLQPIILGKNVEMIATCDLFPDFHVVGIVYKIEQPSNTCIIYVKEKNRIVKVDGGMNGLSFIYQ